MDEYWYWRVALEGDFAAIKTGDDHQYYLLKRGYLSTMWITGANQRWSQTCFPLLHVVEGNYLEQDKEKTGGNLYYIDYKRKDLISAFCVIEIVCHHQQFRGEEVKVFLVNHDMHQKPCEIVNTNKLT